MFDVEGILVFWMSNIAFQHYSILDKSNCINSAKFFRLFYTNNLLFSILQDHFYKTPTSEYLLYTLTYLNNIFYYYFITKYLFINIFFPPHKSLPSLSLSLSLSIVLCLYFSLNSLPHSNLKPRSSAISNNLAAADWQQLGDSRSAVDRWQIQQVFQWVFHVGFCWIFHMGFPLGWIQFLLILVQVWDEFFFRFGLIMVGGAGLQWWCLTMLSCGGAGSVWLALVLSCGD